MNEFQFFGVIFTTKYVYNQTCRIQMIFFNLFTKQEKKLHHKDTSCIDFIIFEIISQNTDHNYKDCLFWVGWQSWTYTPPLGRHSGPWSSTTGCGGLCTSLFLAPIHIHTDPCKKRSIWNQEHVRIYILRFVYNQISIDLLKKLQNYIRKISKFKYIQPIFCVNH